MNKKERAELSFFMNPALCLSNLIISLSLAAVKDVNLKPQKSWKVISLIALAMITKSSHLS